MFSVTLLQAINEWQRGGDAKQKNRRGIALKKETEHVPDIYKTRTGKCFRQIALDKKSVWTIGTEHKIKETISSWTSCVDIAKAFKGGVPPEGYQGVIFEIDENHGETIINLSSLFQCQDFNDFLDENKSKITNYDLGIGKYRNTQYEVVIEVLSLPLESTYALGGYSSPEKNLAKKFFKRVPTEEEMKWFRELMLQAGHKCGAYWLSTPEAVQRVNERLKMIGEELFAKKI